MFYRPESAVWETTFRCNVNCLHCGSGCIDEAKGDELTTAEALMLVEQLAAIGCKNVTLAGGEPLLRKDWPVIASRIVQLGMQLTFISNGYLINPKTISILSELRPATFGISLDAGEAYLHDYIRGKQGCFEKVLKAFDMLLGAGLNVSVVTSIQRINFDQLGKIRDLLLLYGVKAWQIQAATPQGRMDLSMAMTEAQFYETAKFIANTIMRYKNFYVSGADCFGYYGSLQPILHPKGWLGCHAGMGVVGIESNGNIKGCLSLPGELFIEGNIRNRSLVDIWNDPNSFSYNRRFNRDLLTGYCSECTYGSICRGGCRERAYGFTKEVCENPLCLYKIEQNGFSDQEQATLCPSPEEINRIYNDLRPLPPEFGLKV